MLSRSGAGRRSNPFKYRLPGRESELCRDDEFYLFAPSARRIWLVPRDEMRTLTYLGICGVFDPSDRCFADTPSLQTFQEAP